jgi:hypothetical protein
MWVKPATQLPDPAASSAVEIAGSTSSADRATMTSLGSANESGRPLFQTSSNRARIRLMPVPYPAMSRGASVSLTSTWLMYS